MGFGDVNTNSGANATYKFYTQILPLIIGPLQGLCPSVTPGGGEGNGGGGKMGARARSCRPPRSDADARVRVA